MAFNDASSHSDNDAYLQSKSSVNPIEIRMDDNDGINKIDHYAQIKMELELFTGVITISM